MSNATESNGGGGGSRTVGTVTGGMALMHFDEQTRPYTREDFIKFLLNFEQNLTPTEQQLVKTGAFSTMFGMPAAYAVMWRFSRRFAWRRVEKVLPFSWAKTAGRVCVSLSAATLPYIIAQSWFVNAVLENEKENGGNLAFHLKRYMITQRNGMMFARTSTREVTREEQEALSQASVDHVLSNRMANRPSSNGAMDVNLALGQQVMLPVAQSGYKPMPNASAGK